MNRISTFPTLKNFIKPLQIEILKELVKGYLTPKAISLRAQIILSALKKTNYDIAKEFELAWKTVKKWTSRWIQFIPEFSKVAERNEMKKLITKCLKDAPRSGKPSIFGPEDVTKIIHVACSTPESLNMPLSHWSSRSLAIYLQKEQIVSKISHERVAFFLRNLHLQPHRSRYWLNSRTRNSSDYDDRIKEICYLYKNAIEMHKKNIHIVSIDEKSGIQAIERPEPNLVMRSNSPEKIEHEYIRHGTQCLIGNLEVATGKIIVPFVSETRKNEDFLFNIKNLIALDPDAEWIFILDQLNTHKSEALVEFIAQQNEFKGILGKSGFRGNGILKSMKTRLEFLENKNHRIRFQFTPKHCSWMNQIEIWFSGLSKRYLKRASFSSVDNLKEGIFNYIEGYNCYYAKAFKWTYAGKVLQV